MNRKILSIVICLLLILCTVSSFAENNELTDMTGRPVTLDGTADRIVALDAADCEILYALGAGDTLVGRGEYCDYPESVLDVPAVNSGSETNLEEIVNLKPQVVIMSKMAQTEAQVQALSDAGITVIVTDAQDIAGVYEAIRLIGAIVGKDAEAEELVSDMQTTFDDISSQALESDKTVYFEVSPLEYGLWTAGSGTFMDELAQICGLNNAFSDVSGWAEISEEQVIQRNPDYIVTITMYYGEGPTPTEEIANRTGWESITAVASNAIYNADYNEISRPGPRLVEAALSLYDFINADVSQNSAV